MPDIRAPLAIVIGAFVACIVIVPWIDYAISTTIFNQKIRHVIAHRGLGFGKPENSFEAVSLAHEHGYPSEIDVRLSAAGTPFVIHDDTLDRTFRTFGKSCKGSFYKKTDEELDACNVPTAHSFIDGTDFHFMFHIKESTWSDTEITTRIIYGFLDKSKLHRYSFFLDSFDDSLSKESFVSEFSDVVLFFHIARMETFKAIKSVMTNKKHGFAVSSSVVRERDRLVRRLTKAGYLLDVFFPDHPRAVFGVPATHVETNIPLKFDKTKETGSQVGNIYVAHVVGIIIVFGVAVGSIALMHKVQNRTSPKSNDIDMRSLL